MKVIITLAGEGSRFKDVGIREPKHLITVRGRSLFQWSLLSLKHYFSHEFIFIFRNGRANQFELRLEAKQVGINHCRFIGIDELTNGQATTALVAQDAMNNPDEPILIYNIDTYVEPEALTSTPRGDGWIPVFKADGDKWSFVKFDSNLRASDVAEKQRISDYGSIGLYYFKSFALYEKCYQLHNFGDNKERYIAPLYQTLISKLNGEVYAEVLPSEKVHVLGTPEDLIQFAPEFEKRITKRT